jgi:hypothetical protein
MFGKAWWAKMGINLKAARCPRCGTRMPTFRMPKAVSQLLWGGWTCPSCGCHLDRWGKALQPKA